MRPAPDWVQAGNFAASHFTPMQGRVLFHMERLFRSTGNGLRAHAIFVERCGKFALPRLVTDMDERECIDALMLIEASCRSANLHIFRNVDTGWQALARQHGTL